MNPSRIFILRPIATTLLMIALTVIGWIGYRSLPVAALPQVDYPTIQIVTLYPGANADVVAASITVPLERQLGQISGLQHLQSQSLNGASIVTLQFDLDLDPTVADQSVQAAINIANKWLPSDLPNPPIYNKVNPADPPILTLAITSNTIPMTEVQDIVDTRIAQSLSQVSGVGLVTLAGGQRPAIRVEFVPEALASLGISTDTIRNTINAANTNSPKGGFDNARRTISLSANDQLRSPESYASLIIAYKNGAPIRLEDVAKIYEGPENPKLQAWANLEHAILVNVQRQPNANVIQTVDEIKYILPSLTEGLPKDISIQVISDRTESIRSSVADVQFELLLAIGLVIAVIFVFLRNARATLIPGIAVPLSLIGTFAVMHVLGYSINNLTLMAMTIATGFVVDDAIVVVENISRYLEKGENPLQAALKGSREIAFTIISLTISLIAVLIPLLFMQDLIGRLFREFAVTLAVAILISGAVSLTLSPMMCAKLLKSEEEKKPGRLYELTEKWFEAVIAFYGKWLEKFLQHKFTVLLVAIATFVLTVVLFVVIPKGFFPNQDTGVIQIITEAPESISYQDMLEKQQEIIQKVLAHPAVASTTAFAGVDGVNQSTNVGRILVNLKPLEAREARAPTIIQELQTAVAVVPGIQTYFQSVQDLTIETSISRTQYQFTVQANSQEDLNVWIPKVTERLKKIGALTDVTSNLQNNGAIAYLHIDRDRASMLGVSVADVGNALYSAFGQRYISTIFTQSNQYRVVLGMEQGEYGLENLDRIYFTNSEGKPIPLTAIASIHEQNGLLSMTRIDQRAAAIVSFNINENNALGDAVNLIQEALDALDLPDSMTVEFHGATLAFKAILAHEVWLVIAAIFAMYIVLGVLYESFIHPITILSTLPTAGVGALLALILFRLDLSVIAIIGIILLIGIVKKNAIMMIDFALAAERDQGLPPEKAIFQACLLRFRPILMTTMAALLGAIPLMFSSGVGAELRQPLGVAMVGGLIVSQLLTLFTTPVIYLYFDQLNSYIRHKIGKGA